jgi:hypothetical protein
MLVTVLIIITLSCGNPFYEVIDDTVEDFNYETSNEVYFEIETLYSNVPIDIYFGTEKRLTVFSDDQGFISGFTTLPKYVSEVDLKTNFLGLPKSIVQSINNKKNNIQLFR